MIRKVLLFCGIASSLAYVAATILGAMVWPGYNSISQSVSELPAIGAHQIIAIFPSFRVLRGPNAFDS